METKWIGVDLDGTLAHYDTFVSPYFIGEPIPKMVDRVKKWIKEGKDVRILTARVSPTFSEERDLNLVLLCIQNWCLKHIGVVLPVTCVKDHFLEELWDDRAIQVIKNTGERADKKE